MTISKKIFGVILALGLLLVVAGMANGGVVSSEIPTNQDTVVNYEFFASSTAPTTVATTTSATSTNIRPYFDSNGRYDDGSVSLVGAEKATFYFSRGGATSANTGTSTFSIEVSPDGSNWYDFNKLVQNRATSTANITILDSVAIEAATSTTIVSLDLRYDAFVKARCIVVETIDGEHRCRATVEY